MGFAAHFSIDRDRPVAAERMLRAVAIGGERARRLWRGDGAAIGVADGTAFATGPGERAAIFDGRIDNRDDLAAMLGGDAPRDDAALILALHARFGDDTPCRVFGDFALLLWDGVARRVLLATDPGGYRTLFVHQRDGELFVASEARGLFAQGSIDRRLDKQRVGEWLALLPPEQRDRTLFAGIRRMPPGTRAVWAGPPPAIDEWWQPHRLPMLHLPDHRDYAAAVRETLDRAVADRVAGDVTVGAHLSGGLDSTIVSALAARHLAGTGRRLTAFTSVPAHRTTDEPGRFANEWPHAAAVAARYPTIDHVAVSTLAEPIVDMLARFEPALDIPVFNVSNMVWIDAIDREARARAIGVMLTGSGGNMSFSYDGGMLLRQLLHAGRWGDAIAEALAMRRAIGIRRRAVAGRLLYAALPPRWVQRVERLRGHRVYGSADISRIDPGFASRLGLTARMDALGADWRNLDPDDSRAVRLHVLRQADIVGDFANATRRLHGIDTRDPTTDRRLIELCLAIPEDQFQHAGLPRAIARTIAGELLPAPVAGERRRGRQASDWAYGIDAAMPDIAADLASLRDHGRLREWIDLDRMDRAVAAWTGPADANPIEWTALTRALAAARFVRRVEGGNR